MKLEKLDGTVTAKWALGFVISNELIAVVFFKWALIIFEKESGL